MLLRFLKSFRRNVMSLPMNFIGNCLMSYLYRLNFSYQKSSRYEKMGYEAEFSKFLLTLISDVDKRIRRGEQRLVLNSQPIPVSAVLMQCMLFYIFTSVKEVMFLPEFVCLSVC